MPAAMRRNNLLHSKVTRFTRMLPAAEAGDVRAVHRARVASRRLRELVPLLDIDADVRHKLVRRLRKATIRLGKVRELDVLRLAIEELRVSARYPASVTRRLLQSVHESRGRAGRVLAHQSRAADFGRVARHLERLADRVDLEAPKVEVSTEALNARIAKRARTLQRAIEAAGAVYIPERLHDVRIAVKKLRYAVELSVELDARASHAALDLLKHVQQQLGRMHDLQILIEHARRVQTDQTSADTAPRRQFNVLIISLDTTCHRLHARYLRERERLIGICERLSARSGGRSRMSKAAMITAAMTLRGTV